MPRKKPTSTRQKKEQQQLRRAVKRGEVAPPPPNTKKPNKKHLATRSSAPVEPSRKLQSSFIKLPPKFLDETKALASNVPLIRPIPNTASVLQPHWGIADHQQPLACPRRPKWRFEMSKKEVEHNEEGVFKKFLKQMDELVEKWQGISDDDPTSIVRSPTYFERNLEVWRQFWRVTEISQIILVLLDSRCPLLHYPPSLASYLSDRKVILVLTKTDIPQESQIDAWISYFRDRYPHFPVVQVESYGSKERYSSQGRTQYEPRIPQDFKEQLVAAIRKVHSELLDPPEAMKAKPAQLEKWEPPVPKDIDWNAILTSSGKSAEPKPRHSDDSEPQCLTIGLIGQPNVGKSSLLNALFGTTKVRASKTPGKTKHFQTLFWTSDIRLVDCPGLVMPNFVPMEMQVLSGVLPIARISALPACIYFVSNLLPLETILKLTHPSVSEEPVVDKRTWREGMAPRPKQTVTWTAMDILIAYANQKGWVTAKAGRPDVSRAANALLRALAEGRIPWAFWPPGTPPETIGSSGMGISLVNELKEEERKEEMHSESDEDTVPVLGDEQDEDFDHDDENVDLSDSEIAVGSPRRVHFTLLEAEEAEEEDEEEVISSSAVTGGSLGRFALLKLSEEEEDESDDSSA